MLNAVVIADGDGAGADMRHHAVHLGQHHYAGVCGGLVFHTGGDHGRFRHEQRHGLALHVGAHERAVGVVILQEGDHGRRHRDKLLGRNVHVVHLGVHHLDDLVQQARGDAVPFEPVGVRVDGLVGLRDDEVVLLIRGQVLDGIGDDAVLLVHAAVGRLDEAVLVDARIGGQGVDEADVRTFRRLDGAHAAIVGKVNVAHVEGGALTVQAAGAQGRQAALVRQLRQGICLIHKLGQLRGAEKLLDRRGYGADIDEV